MGIECRVRDYAREHLSQKLKPHAWLYYTDLRRLLLTRKLSGFATVQAEINTHCNRACGYCSNHVSPKQEVYMKEILFRKIVDELASENFGGRFCPNLSSEPLLHPQLPGWMSYARNKLPKAKIVVYTNGDFLNRKKYEALKAAGVSQFIVTQHGRSMSEGLGEFRDNLSPEERKMTTFQTLDKVNLFNRGITGLIPEDRRSRPNPCYIAQDNLTILVDGTVVICCNDVNGEHPLGNVSENSIAEVWRNPKYRKLRRQVRRGNFELDVCKRCIG